MRVARDTAFPHRKGVERKPSEGDFTVMIDLDAAHSIGNNVKAMTKTDVKRKHRILILAVDLDADPASTEGTEDYNLLAVGSTGGFVRYDRLHKIQLLVGRRR
jgi:hypothetical protein